MANVVADVSLAFKWVVKEDDTADARALLEAWQRQGTAVSAPSWFPCEVANALYQRGRRADADPLADDIARLLETVLSLVTVVEPEPSVAARAMEIAALLGQKATYDSHYVALAERLGCDLWTADERFARAAREQFPFVHSLGEAT